MRDAPEKPSQAVELANEESKLPGLPRGGAFSPSRGSAWVSKLHPCTLARIKSCNNGWVEYRIEATSIEGQLGYEGGADESDFIEFFTPNVVFSGGGQETQKTEGTK